jgi:hypothetical protein
MSRQEQKVKEGIAPMLDEGEQVLAAIIARRGRRREGFDRGVRRVARHGLTVRTRS